MPWVKLTCRCGHQDDLDAFCSTPISGDLPKGHFQCPACGHAWKVAYGKATVMPSGFVMPGPVELVSVDGRL